MVMIDNRTQVTIRLSTRAERKQLARFWATGKPLQAKRYLVVRLDDPKIWLGAFGLPFTADTREEILYWAERWCSKNDGNLVRPKHFYNVEAALRET